MKPFWAYPAGEDWMMLAFSDSAHEAKKIGYENSPVKRDDAPYLTWRAVKADDKWMVLYEEGVECVTTYPGEYHTWVDYYEAEIKELNEQD